MVKFVLAVVIGTLTGIVSGFGIGGGSLLVLYLAAFAGIQQYKAGGINLLYFIGCAPAALVGHIRQKRIDWTVVLWCSLAGVACAVPAAWLSSSMNTDLLRRLFGIVLLYIGIREVMTKNK